MKTQHVTLIAALIGLAVGCANEPRSRDTGNPNVSGETLALQVCSNCHGTTGNSKSHNFPNLAGQQEAYLVAQLQGFKGHSRADPAGYEYMWGLSRNLSDKQIHELAIHYAALTPERQPLERAAERIAAGKSIFNSGIPDKSVPPCASCHGAEGKGNATFPRQYAMLAKQLLQELAKHLPPDELRRAMTGIGVNVAASLPANLPGDSEQRIARIADLMRDLGYDSRAIEGPDGAEIEAHNCVFHDLAVADPGICEVDLSLLRTLSGQSVEHRRCMARGERSCRFAFKPAKPTS